MGSLLVRLCSQNGSAENGSAHNENAQNGSAHNSTELFTRLVRERQWLAVRTLLNTGLMDEQRTWAVEEALKHATSENDEDTSAVISYCSDDQLVVVFSEAVSRHLWWTIRKLLCRDLDDDLVRHAIKETLRNVSRELLTDYTLPARRDDQCRDCFFLCAVLLKDWKEVGEMLQQGLNETLQIYAVAEARKHADEDILTECVFRFCARDQRNLLLTQAVLLHQWDAAKTLMDRGVDASQLRWAIEEASKQADEDTVIMYKIWFGSDIDQCDAMLRRAVKRRQWRVAKFLMNCKVDASQRRWAMVEASKYADEKTIIEYINDFVFDIYERENTHFEHPAGNDPEGYSRPKLTVDLLHSVLEQAASRHLFERPGVSLKTGAVNHEECPELPIQKSGIFLRSFAGHIFNETLFSILVNLAQRSFAEVIRSILQINFERNRPYNTLLDVLSDCLTYIIEFPMNHIDVPTLLTFMQDDHVFKMSFVFLDTLHLAVCTEHRQARENCISRRKQMLDEIYACHKHSHETELMLVFLFVCLCLNVPLTQARADLLVEILAITPLLPSLQSAAVRLMLRAKRWDVISNAVLCRVWEDVRRSVLRAAVEQRKWSTVQHMADHSLYDDERNWALMQAYYENRWDVVLALADFGHNADQRKRIYRQVAKHGDGKTVLELFKRGADVRTVREQLETANPSRERPLRQETVTRYQNRLSWLAWLEGKIEDRADNLQRAIQKNKWRAVLHRVRCKPSSTLSLALDAAIEKESWPVVMQLARLQMDDVQRNSLFPEVIRRRQWAVGRALLECGYFDVGLHGVSVGLRRAALPQLLNAGQWILVARVMEHGVDDVERRQVMWEALDRREGSVVAHIISIMEGRVCVEERERVFQQAIRQGVWQALKRLVEEKDSAGVTHRDLTLPAAAKHHQWDILTHCLQHGADIDKRDAAGDTILHRAARKEDWEGVAGLLLHGVANQHLMDSQGYSVLNTAFIKRNIVEGPLEQVFIDYKDDPDWDAVKTLVEFQCDVNHPDPNGVTPLQRMIEDDQGEIIKSAMFWGGNVNQTVTWEGKTAIHALCTASVLDNMHIAVARGGNPLAVTQSTGDTVLSLAVKNEKCAQELLAECIRLGISTHQPRITDHGMKKVGKRLDWCRNVFYDSHRSPMYHAICRSSKVITAMLYESGSCSNTELYNIAYKWFDPPKYKILSNYPAPSIREDQAAYVSTIVNTPRRLESMCRLVISHHIGVCKPRRRRERVMTLRLPTWFDHLHDYILFTDLTGSGLGKVRPRRSLRTHNPASRYTFHLATIQDKMAVYFSLTVHNYCGRWQCPTLKSCRTIVSI